MCQHQQFWRSGIVAERGGDDGRGLHGGGEVHQITAMTATSGDACEQTFEVVDLR